MEFKDYYKTLGVAPDADAKAIKAAYRKLARKYHPDVSSEPDAEDRFKEVSEAYEALRDPEKRQQYDELRRYGQAGQSFQPPPGWQTRGPQHANGRGQSSAGFSDFFESIFGAGFGGTDPFAEAHPFGQGGRRPARGQDIEVELPLFLEDTLDKKSKRISYQVPVLDATGRQTGHKKKTLDVKIPIGVSDGERIRLKGQGTPAANQNVAAGDLFIHIRLVPHPVFEVDGHDLRLSVPIAPWEAVLGGKVEVPTLTGRIKLTVPANTQTGHRVRVRGKGLRKRNGHGDLYAEFKVVVPESVSEAEKAHWQALAEQSNFNPRALWGRKQSAQSQKA